MICAPCDRRGLSLVKIKIGFDIEFELPGPTPMILMLYVHPSRQKDLLAEEKILVEPDIPLTDFTRSLRQSLCPDLRARRQSAICR